MKKSIRRRITDVLGITRPTTVMLEMPPLDFRTIHSRHVDLTDKQIIYLEQMISNHKTQNMPICKCDIERVLDMCKEGESQ